MSELRFDLGGVGKSRDAAFQTVNITPPCDIEADITELDRFVADESALEFFLSHTLEHVPPLKYERFLRDMHRKLVSGGRVVVVQTDIAYVLQLWAQGKLSWRAMRATVFTPANRQRQNPYNAHQSMWSPGELAKDFCATGYSRVETFDAGAWAFDLVDDLLPHETAGYHGVPIKNLGVRAFK